MALRRGPLISAGTLLGAGLGGFVDGILLHQILQWHNMLSARVPPDTLVNSKINMYWDGVFHAGVWCLTALGLWLLWQAGARRDVAWSGRTFGGALLLGWGLFNLVEGVIDHAILGLHHVREYSSAKSAYAMAFYDMAFLAFGAALLIGGALLIGKGRHDTTPRGADSGT